MNPSAILRTAQRTPLIRFLGKRSPPQNASHTPEPPASAPANFQLPKSFTSPDSSFAAYRAKAQSHGPLGGHSLETSRRAAHGDIHPGKGEVWDRSELPGRFGRLRWSPEEMEAIDTGGASVWA